MILAFHSFGISRGKPKEKSNNIVDIADDEPTRLCDRYLRDFATALGNVRICERQFVARSSTGCSKSVNLVKNFIQNSSGDKWCVGLGGEKGDWDEVFRDMCGGKVNRGAGRNYCRAIQNQLKAFQYLKCD